MFEIIDTPDYVGHGHYGLTVTLWGRYLYYRSFEDSVPREDAVEQTKDDFANMFRNNVVPQIW